MHVDSANIKAIQLHLQGFSPAICGRYHGMHLNISTAFLKPHSNLQLVRKYSSWKVRIPVSSLNLHPLFLGERLLMLMGHFPVPGEECL